MNKAKPIKIIVEFTDEVVDMCEFVKRVLEDEGTKDECEQNIKDVRIK
jgi:hypothetical protein